MTIGSDLSCATCRIRRDSVASLITRDGDGLEGIRTSVVRDREGYVYVALAGPEITQFDPAGRLMRRIGRAGAGPGEFRHVTKLSIDSRNDLHVFDRLLGRHSVFRRTGEFVGATGLPVAGFVDAALLSDESIVVNSGSFDRSNAGFALLQISKQGSIVRRADELVAGRLQEWLIDRGLTVGSSTGRLIVARRNEFVVEAYDMKLQRVMRLEREAPWFQGVEPAGSGPSDGLFEAAPTSRLVSAWEDARGLIWAVAVVRAPEWEPRARPSEPVKPGSPLFSRPRFETVIEVIDPSARRVVARERTRERLEFRDGYVWQLREAPDGSQQYFCWSLRVER
jgi:hypothetical protein